MNWFSKYPYLDEHELNLDWLIAKMRSLEIQFDEFKVVNNITFSGQWDITKQYPAWTIVSDNNIGYVSLKPVPAGVVLTNTDYWIEVIDYTAQIAGLENRVIALENKVKNAIIPEDFGAIGDGITDDTQALQDWIDYGHDNALSLTTLDGKTYNVTSTLHIITNDIDFNGATLLNNTNSFVLDVTNDSANRYTHLRNLNIDANGANGIQFVNMITDTFDTIFITDIGGIGLQLDSGYEGLFNNIYLFGNATTGTKGVVVNTPDCHMSNVIGTNLEVFFELNERIYLNLVHGWVADQTLYPTSIFIDCNHFDSIRIENSNCDTFATAFRFTGNSPSGIVENTIFMYANQFIPVSADTYLIDCGADITSYSRYLDKFKFIGCQFSKPTNGSYLIAKNCLEDKYVPVCIDNCKGLSGRDGDLVDLTSLSDTTFSEGTIKIKYGFALYVNGKILLPANQQKIFEVPGAPYSLFAFAGWTGMVGLSDTEWEITDVAKANINSTSTNKTMDSKLIFTRNAQKYVSINATIPLYPLT